MKKEIIRKHFGILLVGIIYALKGTLAFALLAGAVALFICIPIDVGYLAVGKFVGGILVTGAALGVFYWCGRDLLKGTFSK